MKSKRNPLVTGGSAARNTVYWALSDEYRDSGLTEHLMCGCLDAPSSMAAGSTEVEYELYPNNSLTAVVVTRQSSTTRG